MKQITVISLLITVCLASGRLFLRDKNARKLSKFEDLNVKLVNNEVDEFEKIMATIDILDAVMQPWKVIIEKILEKEDRKMVARYLTALIQRYEHCNYSNSKVKAALIKDLAKMNYPHRVLKLILHYCRPSNEEIRQIRNEVVEDRSKVILVYLIDQYLRHSSSPDSLTRQFSVGQNRLRLCIRLHGSIPTSHHTPAEACEEYCHLESSSQDFTMLCGDTFMALGDKCPVDQIFRVIELLENATDNDLHDRMSNFTIPPNLNLVVAVQKKDQLHIVKCGTPTALVYTEISQDTIQQPAPLPSDPLAGSSEYSEASSLVNASINISDDMHRVRDAEMSYCMVQIHHKDLIIMVTDGIRSSVKTFDVTGVLQQSTIEERSTHCEYLKRLFDSKIGQGDGAAFCLGSVLDPNLVDDQQSFF